MEIQGCGECGICYLCGRPSNNLRRICIYERDNPLLCYLCPDCHIYSTKEIENPQEVSWKDERRKRDGEV